MKLLSRAMRCFRRERKLEYPKEVQIVNSAGSGPLTAAEIKCLYVGDKNWCPDCYHHGFYAGPRGGGSQNYRCGLCGMGFNLSGGFGDERIGLPFHLWDDEVKKHRHLLGSLLDAHGFRTSEENWGIESKGRHGIWIWSHRNFMTVPEDFITVNIFTWDPGTAELWKKHSVQLPDPDFICKIDRILG